MVRILFVCHGNICRSPMAEFVMRDLLKRAGLDREFTIESAATSDDETGNPVYPPARRKLLEHGVECPEKTARQLVKQDYYNYDLLIGMDTSNIANMRRICGGDSQNRISRLLDWTNTPRDISDPWYTGDFDAAFSDVSLGCRALLKKLVHNNLAPKPTGV